MEECERLSGRRRNAGVKNIINREESDTAGLTAAVSWGVGRQWGEGKGGEQRM